MNDEYYQSFFSFYIGGLFLEQMILKISTELFGLFVNMDKIFCFEKLLWNQIFLKSNLLAYVGALCEIA